MQGLSPRLVGRRRMKTPDVVNVVKNRAFAVPLALSQYRKRLLNSLANSANQRRIQGT